MHFDELIRTLVGADLSATGRMFRYPNYFVQCHYRPLLDFRSPDEQVKSVYPPVSYLYMVMIPCKLSEGKKA